MTARARLTQAELQRAIRAAKAEGAVAVLTPQGIVFAESDAVALPSPDQARGNSCDDIFGTGK